MVHSFDILRLLNEIFGQLKFVKFSIMRLIWIRKLSVFFTYPVLLTPIQNIDVIIFPYAI